MLLDTWLMFQREIRLRYRNRVWVAIDVSQPLLYIFLFGPLMKQFVSHTPGFPPGSMWMIFTPAMMMQVAITAGSFVGIGLLADYRAGVVERFKVTPCRPSAQLMGRILATALNVTAMASMVVASCVVFFDLRPPLVGVISCFAVVSLFAVFVATCSYSVALRLKNERSVSALINAVMLPLLLLSGTLVPITEVLAPKWLYSLSRLNPVTYMMDAARATFRGDLNLHSIGPGLVILSTLTLASIWWGTKTIAQEDA
ncbi:ABC transporter permease [Lentzea sp. NPDC006480]|uniref:ABC transporter permease n=1 Tax=Lentzea sp. NPDC006480 TaxID=3157176 RepID=UPI0033B9E3DF